MCVRSLALCLDQAHECLVHPHVGFACLYAADCHKRYHYLTLETYEERTCRSVHEKTWESSERKPGKRIAKPACHTV